jgi:hypothetical protein
MSLSSVQTIAGAGLLANPPADIGVALVISAGLGTALDAYINEPVIDDYDNIVTQCTTNAPAALDELRALGSTNLPALTNNAPSTYTLSQLYPAPNYNSQIFYSTGSQVIYQGRVFSATTDTQGQAPSLPYSDETTYDTDDRVLYNSKIYKALGSTTGNLPTDPTYWSLVGDPTWTVTLTVYPAFSSVITATGERILGNGDLSRFCQIFGTAQGYVFQSNSVIEAGEASTVLARTFSTSQGGMNTLTTGGLNQVSNNLLSLSTDMSALGQLINLANLDELGFPGALLAQIGLITGGTLPNVADLLLEAGIDESAIRELSFGTNALTNEQEKLAYQVMLSVTGEDLDQILTVLGVTASGITNMAQLLDPRRIFPKSYYTLLCPTVNGLYNIYLGSGSNWSVNTNLVSVFATDPVQAYVGANDQTGLETLSKIIPSDQALANKCLARSLQQVKQIASTNLAALARAMITVETNDDLSAISTLSVPIPNSVRNFYEQSLGEGTGANGRVLLSDVIGVPSGIGLNADIDSTVSVLGQMQQLNAFAALITDGGSASSTSNGVYTVMDYALTTTSYVLETPDYPMPGDTGYQIVIPSGLPGAGTYPASPAASLAAAREDAMTAGLIPAAATAIANIVSQYPTQCDALNQTWIAVADYVKRNVGNLALAEVDFNQLGNNSQSSTMIWAEALHEYGVDISPGGANEIVTALANTATLSGQSVLASLREGRNIQRLNQAGIQLDTQLN